MKDANTAKILNRIRSVVKKESPRAEETISYGIPTFKLAGKNLVHFASYKNHIGLYPTPAAISFFKKDLASYKTAKGSIQFPLDKPIPYDLIRKIVIFRIKAVNNSIKS